MRACPFCHEADFDAVGLKVHLSSGHCEAYESTPSPARTVRLGSPHPAATAREEAWKAMVELIAALKPEGGSLTFSGSVNALRRLGTAIADAERALALARSTGGSNG